MGLKNGYSAITACTSKLVKPMPDLKSITAQTMAMNFAGGDSKIKRCRVFIFQNF